VRLPSLFIDATRERLAVLGLSHGAEVLDQVLADAVRSEIPAHAFLDQLLTTELAGREERRIRTTLKRKNLEIVRNAAVQESGNADNTSLPIRHKLDVVMERWSSAAKALTPG
jgi:hypothetical protein